MLHSREKIISFLEEVEKIPLTKLWFADTKPGGEKKFLSIAPPRILLALSGKKHFRFSCNGEKCDVALTPGEILVVPPRAWTTEIWDQAHSMISIAFTQRYVRIIYVEHNGLPPDHYGPDIFFHTKNSLLPEGRFTLDALLQSKRDTASSRLNFQALLKILLEMLQDLDQLPTWEDAEWNKVKEAMHSNYQNSIAREDIAALVKIHPARLSRLVQSRTKQTFIGYLSSIRLEHALELLKGHNLTIAEIANHCGFNYTNYFIRVFNKRYGMSPEKYRKRFFNN